MLPTWQYISSANRLCLLGPYNQGGNCSPEQLIFLAYAAQCRCIFGRETCLSLTPLYSGPLPAFLHCVQQTVLVHGVDMSQSTTYISQPSTSTYLYHSHCTYCRFIIITPSLSSSHRRICSSLMEQLQYPRLQVWILQHLVVAFPETPFGEELFSAYALTTEDLTGSPSPKEMSGD